ncbi:MAG: T9SS type A sorting domain-containing protein [Flavobacteriales bacterium]|nr:T9SS type A sorting domain-containing protein [Flavobacteriales bacterium]MBP9079851.1 T9SS type A sorting domain-containing protein [Flavobacteriales bacterium]
MRPFFPILAGTLLFSTTSTAQNLTTSWGGGMGSTGSDIGTGIVLDATGHIYTTGNFAGTMDADPGPGVTDLVSEGSSDIYVSKFDTSGNLVWARAMGGAYGDGANAIAVDASGNVYTTGGFCGTADFDPGAGSFTLTAATTGQNDIFVSKLDPDGNFIWAKGVVGGTWWDAGYGIAVDPTGNVVITGRFYHQGGPRDFDPGPATFFLTAGHEDIFVLKLDQDGDFVWAVNFGSATDESRAYAIAMDEDGNIFITGYFRGTVDFDAGPGTFNMTSVGTWNVFYLKLDPNANLAWVKSLPITTTTYHNEGLWGRKIAIDANGDLLTTGRYGGTIDFDPGTGTHELISTGAYDLFVAMYTNAGELVWAKSMGGTGHDEGFGITAGPDGSVLVAGTFQAMADFDPGTDTLEMVSMGDDDTFILRLDGNGDLMHAASMGGAGNDRGQALAVSGTGGIYLTGRFEGSTDLDPGSGVLNAESAGSHDAFLVKLIESDGTGIADHAAFGGAGISIYPNPANERVNLSLGASMAGAAAEIELLDATGKCVHAEEVPAPAAHVAMELPASLREGMYLVRLRMAGQEPRSARIIIQR